MNKTKVLYKTGYVEIECKNRITKQPVLGYAKLTIPIELSENNVAKFAIVSETAIWAGFKYGNLYDCGKFNKGNLIRDVEYVDELGKLL